MGKALIWEVPSFREFGLKDEIMNCPLCIQLHKAGIRSFCPKHRDRLLEILKKVMGNTFKAGFVEQTLIKFWFEELRKESTNDA